MSSKHSASRLPVTQSLLKTLRLLSQPSNNAFKPTDIVNVLGKHRNILNKEQQDAQEIYQLLVNELEAETDQLAKKQGGLKDLLSFGASKKTDEIKSPLRGSITDRRSCTACGYTVSIRYQRICEQSIQLYL